MVEGAPVPSIFDCKALDKIREMGRQAGLDNFLAELADICLEQSPPLDGFRSALDQGDALALENMAHAVSGNASSLGAHRLTAICDQMESHAVKEEISNCQALFDDFELEYRRFKSELKTLTKPS